MINKEKKTERKRLNLNVKEFIPNGKKKKEKPASPPKTHLESLIDLLVKMNTDYKYNNFFPRLPKYKRLEKVRMTFLPMSQINKEEASIEHFQDATFFLLNVKTPDDIHKAMKYGICTSSTENIERLSSAYLQARKEGRKVVIFFRVTKEKNCCGAAELTSDFLSDQRFDYWWESGNEKGIFRINWLFVKNLNLSTISIQENGKRMINLQSGSVISSENGYFMLDMYRHLSFKFDESILKFFELFDQREDYLIGSRMIMDVQIKLTKQEKKVKPNVFPSTNTGRKKKEGWFDKKSSKQRFSAYEENRECNPYIQRKKANRGKKSQKYTPYTEKKDNTSNGFVYIQKSVNGEENKE